MNRRQFLHVAGAAAGGVTLLGLARADQIGLLGPREGYEAWDDLERERGLRAIVAAGVLAANPHNSQPWRFQLWDHGIDVHLDLGRALGPVDPFLRQMHLGIGCAIENLNVAATTQGLRASTVLFPAPGEVTLAARITLARGGVAPARHAAAIAHRHTHRGPYDPARALAEPVRTALRAQVTDANTHLEAFEAGSAAGRGFVDATLRGTEGLIEDDAFMRATDAWFRWTPRQVGGYRDGPALDAAGLTAWKRVAAQLAPRPSTASYHRAWLAATREIHLATASTYGVISVRDPAQEPQLIEAGRLWQRLHLEATLQGVAMQPLDQWLELIDRTRQRGRVASQRPGTSFAPAGFIPVMMFRAGLARRAARPSARRRLDDVLVA